MKSKEIKKEMLLQDSRQRISLHQALDYEIHGHWLTFWIWGFSWGQKLIIGYTVRKVKRKYKRYKWAKSFTVW